MNTRVLVILSLFAAIGAVLHMVMPPFYNGMKPDMILLMMFIGIIMFPSMKNVTLLGIVTGFLSALTSTFPGGFLPNIIDKIITAFVFYGLFLVVKKIAHKVATATVLAVIGTIVSGTIFLTAALLIVGLPGGVAFTTLFLTVVLPATLFNGAAMIIILPIVQSIFKRSKNLTVA
ncbi:tryptophan transporter [Metabacillus litoralis]|uniref:tryptophan transporter n=1 Tax=Metabacillus TaxID=2675233 RepID=UPI000EF60F81|nr:tryptophan transporter [Metabacillus litoralis]MCM3161980.1 tryptophan transporter [Metabacillus litoralis]MCM3411312.1 tryptophan transporter [Metabacillus litoralis]